MDGNPNLELLMQKIFDDEKIVDEIMKTDDMVQLYGLCQKIQDGYTFEEFVDFFDDLVCICLDEIEDLKKAIEENSDEIGKLGENDLKKISGGARHGKKLTASVLASLIFVTNASGTLPAYADEFGGGASDVQFRPISSEDPGEKISAGKKFLNWLDKGLDYVWDNKGKILLGAAALVGGGALLIAEREDIGSNINNTIAAYKDKKRYEYEKSIAGLTQGPSNHNHISRWANGKTDGEIWGKYRHPSGAVRQKEWRDLEKDLKTAKEGGIIKSLTNNLVLAGAFTSVAGGVTNTLKELTNLTHRVSRVSSDIQQLRFFAKQSMNSIEDWRARAEIEMQKQAAKNYDPEREEEKLRYMFDHYIHGQEAAKKQIMQFFTQYSAKRKAAAMGASSSKYPGPTILIFNGPSGTGKTFMAQLLAAAITSLKLFIITAQDVLDSSKSNPASMPYSVVYGNASKGGMSKDDAFGATNLKKYLEQTSGSDAPVVILLDEADKLQIKDSQGNVVAKYPLDELWRSILDNKYKGYDGRPIDWSNVVIIVTSNETKASLDGRIKVTDGRYVEAKVDENGNLMLDENGDPIYGKPTMDSSGTQTLVPHDPSLMMRLAGSICYFDKLTADDYEIIARDALGDDRSIKSVDDYQKLGKPNKVSLISRLTTGIGGVVITDKGYRLIAEYASKMPNAARSIVGAGANTTGSVSGNLDFAIIDYVSKLKSEGHSCKDLTLLAEPYESKDSTGHKTIQFNIKALGYEEYDKYVEQYKNAEPTDDKQKPEKNESPDSKQDSDKQVDDKKIDDKQIYDEQLDSNRISNNGIDDLLIADKQGYGRDVDDDDIYERDDDQIAEIRPDDDDE